VKAALVLAALVATLVLTVDAGAARKPWLWQCTQIHNAEAQYHCYVRLLLLDVQASRDPARELPRIDRRVESVGGPVEAGCHVLMHEVGREWARAHHLTLADLQHYVPRSNNPNCSAARRSSSPAGRRRRQRARGCRRAIACTRASTGSGMRCCAPITAIWARQ
jgi:hypothetical protein